MSCPNNREIERKFTVSNLNFKKEAYEIREIRQGLLNIHGKNEIRVTIRGKYAWICIKNNKSELNRFEWEREIPIEEAELLLSNCCCSRIISKTRYLIKNKEGLKWEVDEFHGDDEGLILAEIEIPYENFDISLPEWIDKEVTGIRKYYNHTLSMISWKEQAQYEEDWEEFAKMNIC